MELLRDAQRAIAADRYECGRVRVRPFRVLRFRVTLSAAAAFAVANFGGELPAVCRTQNGAAAHQEPTNGLIVEHSRIARRQQAVVPAKDADCFPTALRGRLGNRANHRIQSGTIATTNYYADPLTQSRGSFPH